MSNTPTDLAAVIGLGLLAFMSFIGMLGFFFVGMVFKEAFIPAFICLGLLLLAGYRLYHSR
jgi:hypothetical protein